MAGDLYDEGDLYDDADAEVIAAELVACTLGARARLELRTDLTGKLAYALGVVSRALAPLRGLTR